MTKKPLNISEEAAVQMPMKDGRQPDFASRKLGCSHTPSLQQGWYR
jgi:hypothetical protein